MVGQVGLGRPNVTNANHGPQKKGPARNANDGGKDDKLRGITQQQMNLPDQDRGSMCGIVAAEAFAKSAGKNVPLDKIKQSAQEKGGYSPESGMGGPEGQVKMLNDIGVKSEKKGVDWKQIAKDVEGGKPVTIDSPMHYYVAEGYDKKTNQFEFGETAKAVGASKTKFTPEELEQGALGGSPDFKPRSAIHRTE